MNLSVRTTTPSFGSNSRYASKAKNIGGTKVRIMKAQKLENKSFAQNAKNWTKFFENQSKKIKIK